MGYSRVQKGYRCYCPTLRCYFVSTDVAFFETTPFSLPSTVTSQGGGGGEEDLLVYTFASPIVSPKPASIPAQIKPLITQIYTRRQHPPVLSPPPAAETTPFSLPSTVTSQGEEEDLLVYTFASPIVSPKPASVPAQVKPLITQVYTRRQHPPVLSPPPAASPSNPVLSDDLPIALRKGKRKCSSHFLFLLL